MTARDSNLACIARHSSRADIWHEHPCEPVSGRQARSVRNVFVSAESWPFVQQLLVQSVALQLQIRILRPQTRICF